MMSSPETTFVGWARWQPLSCDVDPGKAILAACRRPNVAVLDSAVVHPRRGRFTVIALDPIDRIQTQDTSSPDPFARLAEHLARCPIAPAESATPFTGGWIGYLGYEAGRWIEDIPIRRPPATRLPLVKLDLYDTLLVFDHLENRWHVAGIDWAPDAPYHRPPLQTRFATAEAFLENPATACFSQPEPAPTVPEPTLRQSAYEARVRKALAYIAAGDIYQVNFAHHFRIAWHDGGPGLYRRLRRSNPAAYSAYLADGNHAVLSSSPELFLELQGGRVVTRPIKGTRPHIGDPIVDAPQRDALLASAKDHAELAMIVDLERNDLGRVCEFGSVRVTEPFALEKHPTVYHLVATVTGRLRDGLGPADLLRATFPGGSITGAPKIRAMQIIDELETHQRGPYCGSIGYIGLDGTMRLNIAIRTIVLDHDTAVIPVGGGIVADSNPADEYEETLAKARGMLAALNATEIGAPLAGGSST